MIMRDNQTFIAKLTQFEGRERGREVRLLPCLTPDQEVDSRHLHLSIEVVTSLSIFFKSS